jgi:release factor glutamine methyltransferase
MSREPLRVAVLEAARTLADAEVPSPRADAEWLAAHLLGVPRGALATHPLVDTEWVVRYRDLVERRARREPLQFITGEAVLGRITVAVGPGVFIPRPETELLVEWALEAISGIADPTVVDLCTGSGAIALAIAAGRPDAVVVAVERSSAALGWARRNFDAHADAGGSRVTLRSGDITDERVLSDLDGTADLVVANPPYVPEGTPVDPEVGRHDPVEAVFAGPDGLAVIRPLVAVAAALLKPGGVLAFEHDDTHGESVPALLSARRVLADVEDHVDLNGRPRFVTARRVRLPSAAPAPQHRPLNWEPRNS